MPTKTTSTPKNRRIRLTLGQQVQVCHVAATVKSSVSALAFWATDEFDLPIPLSRKAVARILRDREKILACPETCFQLKNIIDMEVRSFEDAVAAEFDIMEQCIETVTGEIVIAMAQEVAERVRLPASKRPSFSLTWLYRFLKRHGISLQRKHGEATSVDTEIVRTGRADMLNLTDGYERRDIYNMDETSFYYRQEVRTTLSRRRQLAGNKANKTRLTLCVCTNAGGSDKLLLLFIGTSVQPIALRGHDIDEKLGVECTNSLKGWMNSRNFTRWMAALDAKMRFNDRHILLLVDNVSSHVRPETPLTNARLEFLPKNTTSDLQPLHRQSQAQVSQNSSNRQLLPLPRWNGAAIG
jgi:hypothetical protein